MTLKLIVLAIYTLMIVWIGVSSLRKTKSFTDFFLGGGQVGPIMSAFTYGTAYFSAVLFIGFAGKIGWAFGYSSFWIALGNSLIGVFAVWWLLGERIKNMSLQYQVSTMNEFLEKRYESRFLKLFAALCIFIFFIPYSAAVFMGLSYLFTSNFAIPYSLALTFMGFFTALYLSLGGYKSMTRIDVIFGIIMCVGVSVLLFSSLSKAGGLSEITSQLNEINGSLTSVVGPPGVWPLFSLVFLTSIAPFAMPQLVQKFYAIKDKQAIRIGMYASTSFALLITTVAYFIGASTRVFLNPTTSPAIFKEGKPIFDALMPTLLTQVVPDTLSVVILILILSASMSTLAALVLISSSSISKDLYAGFINREVSDEKLTLLMRISSVFFVFLSVLLAYFKPAGIVSILGISWGAIGSVFLGPFIWGLYSKKVNRLGAISGSMLSLLVCILLYTWGFSSPEAGTIGMISSLVTVPLVSLLKARG